MIEAKVNLWVRFVKKKKTISDHIDWHHDIFVYLFISILFYVLYIRMHRYVRGACFNIHWKKIMDIRVYNINIHRVTQDEERILLCYMVDCHSPSRV